MSMTADVADTEALPLEIRPLGQTMAAEVIGLDLSQPLDHATFAAIYDAFVQYHVLAFRDQRLTKAQQIEFSLRFGPIEGHIARNKGLDFPEVNVVSNLGPDGRPSGKVGSQNWHSDKSFRPEPSLATFLYGVEVPPEGGETCFADLTAAYEALPAAERAELAAIRVVHSWELSQQKKGLTATEEEIRDAPPMVHPLVRTLPDNTAKCLFMGQHASHFDGMPMEAGRKRLAELEAYATQERFVYRHKWRLGDLLMWDNRCLIHRADGTNFDAARYPRVLYRTCVRGHAVA